MRLGFPRILLCRFLQLIAVKKLQELSLLEGGTGKKIFFFEEDNLGNCNLE